MNWSSKHRIRNEFNDLRDPEVSIKKKLDEKNAHLILKRIRKPSKPTDDVLLEQL